MKAGYCSVRKKKKKKRTNSDLILKGTAAYDYR